jgi:hypothetical protein
MTRIKNMTVKKMKPPIAQRAVLGVGSSPGACVTILAARGCVGVSMFLYMTTKRREGNIGRAEILHSSVRESRNTRMKICSQFTPRL